MRLPAFLAALQSVSAQLKLSQHGQDTSPYEERYIAQTLDHFRFTSAVTKWQHRYLFDDSHWTGEGELVNGCKGPILLYTGNEGDIENFWAATGFMHEVLAPKWHGLLVYPEERYYGKSLPFGNKSFTAENIVYLTTEQVLEDYVELVLHLKATLQGAANCPVVAFGGSYGAKLTTYLRLKYPHIVIGGLAASSSIGYSAPQDWASRATAGRTPVSKYTWMDIVSKVYSDAHPNCLHLLQQAIDAIKQVGATADGRASLQQSFHLCSAPPEGVQPLVDWFTDAIESTPQMNYPYPVPPFPFGWPVNETCRRIVSATVGAGDVSAQLIKSAAQISDVFYGYNASNPSASACLLGIGQGGIPGGGPAVPMTLDPTDTAWGYQSCTETLHQFSSRGGVGGPHLRTFEFKMSEIEALCRKIFNAKPNTIFPNVHYGGYNIGDGRTGLSNVIFSEGLLDPWHGGGFYTDIPRSSPSLVPIVMARGAHHLDLRGPHPEDPPEVTAARQQMEKIMAGWIHTYANADAAASKGAEL